MQWMPRHERGRATFSVSEARCGERAIEMKRIRLLGMLHALILVVAFGVAACSDPGPPSTSTSSASGSSGAPSVVFTDVTKAAGLGDYRHETGATGNKYFPETLGPGCGFIDYDGDGWLDIVLVGGGTWSASAAEGPPALWLFRNNQDGTFSNVTSAAGLSKARAYGYGVTVADYDNDGDHDIFLTALRENLLFRNDGGVFTEVAKKAGLANYATWSTAALFFDADRDGHLDLYVGGYVDWTQETDVFCTLDGKTKSYCTPEVYEGVTGRFYQNNGDGTFSERTSTAGFAGEPGKALGVSEFDYNRDGWPDLVVANDQRRNLLYTNNGNGTFTERGVLSGIAFNRHGRARAGMGIDTGVVDSTNEETVFIGNFSREMIGVFRHSGGGLFSDRATSSRIGTPSFLTLTFGLFLFDVDFDKDLDLFAANGHLQEEISETQEGVAYRQRPQLFVNHGDGTFAEFAPGAESPLAEPLLARGAAYGDVDHDGDLDVMVVENGGSVHLLRNEIRRDTPSEPRFLRVALEGQTSNRDGIGSRVVAAIGRARQERRVRTGSSYLSQSEKTVTIALDTVEQVDTLWVHWPSGLVDRFESVQENQQVLVSEGETIDPLGPRPASQ